MVDSSALLSLVGRLKVAELARSLDISVEQLVERVGMHASPAHVVPVTPGPRAGGPSSPAAAAVLAEALVIAPPPPAATETGSPTYRQVHEAVDRWLLGEVLATNANNITHTSAQLGLSRRRTRERWAQVRALGPNAMVDCFALVGASRPPPSVTALRALGTHAAVHDEVDRWLLHEVFEQEGHNVTHASRRLEISRRNLRERRDRLGLG